MQDRPSIDELLEAVAGFLQDDVMPNTSGRLSFHARVSANVIQMIRRELSHLEEHVTREWQGLDALLGPEERPASVFDAQSALTRRNHALTARIQAGHADSGPFRDQLLAHLRVVLQDKLAVSNPALAAEAAKAT